jgi:outer membrane receptor for ferrienterochelin and colicins
LIYSPWQTTTFKALFGEAYRAPNVFERFYNETQSSHAELQPERIGTYEFVAEQYLSRRYRLSASAFYYDVDDLITQRSDAAGNLFFENLHQGAHALGTEFEAEAKYESGLLARASYTLQRAEDESGAELTSSPRHLAKLNLSVPVYRDKVFTSIELQYHSTSRTLAGRHADEFVMANLTLLSREVVKNLEVSATIYNLFDTRYGYPGAGGHLQDVIAQDGRSFRVKLTYKF